MPLSSRETVVGIALYAGGDKSRWDAFVAGSKNGTFLFFRDYMDYHCDRFVDHSLLVNLPGKDAPLCLLPANRVQNTLVTHGGLTYGGFVTDSRMSCALMLEVFVQTMAFLQAQGIQRLVYKTIPHIYHRLAAEEDRYALFRLGAALSRRDVLSVAQPDATPMFQERRARGVRKAEIYGVRVGLSTDYRSFWALLEENLSTVHGTKPVHSVSEMLYLRDAFPNHIKLYAAWLGSEMVAGTVIYETDTVAHAQYIATSVRGRSSRALDLLFSHLLQHEYRTKPYFDFGISTEDNGRVLNAGLVAFKEGFGARTIAHDFYELQIAA